MKKSLLALLIPAIALTGCGNSGKDNAGNYGGSTPSVGQVGSNPAISADTLEPAFVATDLIKKSDKKKRPPLPTFFVPAKSGSDDANADNANNANAGNTNNSGNANNSGNTNNTGNNNNNVPPQGGPDSTTTNQGKNIARYIENKVPKVDDKGEDTKELYDIIVNSASQRNNDLRSYDVLINGKNGELGNVTSSDDGRIVLKDFSHNAKVDGFNTYDIGINAAKDDADKKAFSAVKTYYGRTGSSVYLRDPAAAGFKYQTFGQVFIDPRTSSPQSLGFISVGQGYIIDPTLTFDAEYKGIAMGVYDGKTQTISDVQGKLKWGTDRTGRTLEIEVMNTKQSKNNIADLRYNPIVDAPQSFNFKDTLTWNGRGFANNSGTTAHLYGPKAEEIGGTFMKQRADGSVYEGAFGATKQPTVGE